MKNVRVFFEKTGKMKFISHLDMNRFFTRILRRSKLPVWYTEGFHPHPYIAFALPLSLGFESCYEVLDFKVEDDEISFEKIMKSLEAVVPSGIKIKTVAEPLKKSGKISFAGFDVIFENDDTASAFFDYLNGGNVVVSKKTKKGQIKIEEISEKIVSLSLNENTVSLILPAGNDNINPTLLVTSFCEKTETEVIPQYIRTAIYDEEKKLFR